MKIVRTTGAGKRAAYALLEKIEQRGAVSTARVAPVVHRIMADVRRNGDRALFKYAKKFDALSTSIAVTKKEMAAAWNTTTPEIQTALKTAAQNIQLFAEAQLPEDFILEPAKGVRTGQIIRPLDSVGCYVPGGRYPLPSTLLMTTIPAQVAGVPRIVVTSPRPARETLAAAHLAGITEFYRTGGAQAIAALAYGTETISAVSKIVGPGNLYVTAAKIIASAVCGIDMPAGPTEIVVTSEMGNAILIASDLVAQAEHDPETLAVFITSNAALAKQVLAEAKKQSRANSIAKQSLAARGIIFLTVNTDEAHNITNRLAPEHLTVDSTADLAWVQNAGSVFIGPFSAQSLGDYVSGPNHVLPTGRAGRMRGGLSVLDFVKIITVQQYTAAGLKQLGPHAVALAEAEGLKAHAESVRIRLQS